MQRNTKIIILLFIALLWSLFSWRWYTCGVKGFCEQKIAVEPVKEKVVKKVEIKKECGEYLHSYISINNTNEEKDVRKLETFLNNSEKENLPIDGFYDAGDLAAVKRFQEKYRAEVLTPWGMEKPSGKVYKTTKAQVNKIFCQIWNKNNK